MDRKEFIAQVGLGAAAVLIPACINCLSGCKKKSEVPSAPANVDFTVDVSSGPLATNGGFIVRDSVIVARTNAGIFIAVSAICTHQGTTINFNAGGTNFICPNHQSHFDSEGKVTQGPATSNLRKYNTTLTGTSLHVFS